MTQTNLEPLFRGEDWNYLAEGGNHVVFEYNAVKQIQEIFVDKVLRIRKCSANSAWTHPLLSSSKFLHDYDRRVNRVLYSDSSDFFQKPVYYRLDKIFLMEISEIAKLQRSSKFEGQPLWDTYICNNSRDYECLELFCGELYNNMFLIRQECTGSSADEGTPTRLLTLELKIKGGYPSKSPFLSSPSSQIKRRYTRYQLKQFCDPIKHSMPQQKVIMMHDPRDLFSADASLIRNSISDLIKAQKSTLKVFIDSKSINWAEYWGSQHPELGQHGPLENVLDSAAATEFVIKDVITNILLNCSLMGDISMVQRLDYIDIEGAHKVFSRLTTLTGSAREAEGKLIESVTQMEDLLNALRDAGAELLGHDNENKIPTFLRDLAKLQHTLPTLRKEENLPTDAYVESLGTQECCMLLNLWLISLAAKDSALMVSLKFEKSRIHSSKCVFGKAMERSTGSSPPCAGNIGQMELTCLPQCQHCASGSPSKLVVQYSCYLIDTGYKSPSKCWEKLEEEVRLCEMASSVVLGRM